MNNVALAPDAVKWTPAATGIESAVVVDTNGKVFLRPTVMPVTTASRLITATKADDPTVTATAQATAHVATMEITAPAQLQASGGTQLSTVMSIDARVPDPQGPVTGGVTFYLTFKNRFGGEQRIGLCSAALTPVTVDTPGVRSSSAGCVSTLITHPDIVIGQTYRIQATHSGSATYPKQGLFYSAQNGSTLVP
jgi:hypothetical protein